MPPHKHEPVMPLPKDISFVASFGYIVRSLEAEVIFPTKSSHHIPVESKDMHLLYGRVRMSAARKMPDSTIGALYSRP